MILVPVQGKAEIVLNNVFFNFDSYALLAKSKSELDRMVEVMKDNANIQVSIIGHTDNIGTEAYNLALSRNRAKSVVEYLIAKGVDQTRLTYEGKGELFPAVPNTTPQNRAKNRRVNFKVD